MEAESRELKEIIYRLSWGMRGGITADDLFNHYSYEDRIIINKIIKDNIEITKKNQMPLL